MEIPFNPIRRWHLTISRCHKTPVGVNVELLGELKTDEDINVVMLKGDPMAVLKKCKFYSLNGKLMEIDEKFKAVCKEKWEEYGNHGFRVIAFAMKHFISKKTENFSVNSNNYPINDLIFHGMVSMFDPPKKEIIKTTKKFQEAGIKIIMVTGDSKSSVLSVAKVIGLTSNEESQNLNEKTVLSTSRWKLKTGDNLSLYTSVDWDKTFEHEVILSAHVNPIQKLQIVQEAQKRKETVAFAGINSVSAADIGIAFSDISTDFVQNVAGIIITDNFSLILKGIEQGRQMFDNLCFSIAFTLSHFWAEIFPILLTFIFEMPLALQPLQILLINLITDLLSSILLVCENSPKTDIMKLPPRNQKKRLISCSLFLYAYGFAGIAMALGCFGAYLSVFWYHGYAFKDLVLTSEEFWDYNCKNLTISSGNVFNGNQQVFIRQQASAARQGTLILAQVRKYFLIDNNIWIATKSKRV
uniref:Cation-transporting P-type ATPase C-terminal domain-containing protein n=1 Tax=Panagrolaimus davidi TaxID=227884 RepID=A0A914PKC4_9BILA